MRVCITVRNVDVQKKEEKGLHRPGGLSHYLASVDPWSIPSPSGHGTKKVL